MFIVEIGAVWSTVLAVSDDSWFSWLTVFWLWLTVLFANLAEAVAEGRGKAQADALRKSKSDTVAHRLKDWSPGTEPSRVISEDVAGPLLQQGDIVVVTAGEVIPGDGDVVEGIASVDESAITGESAPVIRESGGDRSAVTGGTTVLSDRIVVKITQKPGESFVDRMIALVEGANRQKTPNEIALNILLAALTIIFVFAVATLQPLAIYSKVNNPGVPDTSALNSNGISGIVLVALLVCLIPTTIGALLSAIGIAGMDRLVQRNVLAMSGRAVEAAGDVNTLLLDKTGTITLGQSASLGIHSGDRGDPRRIWLTPPSCPASPTKPPRAVPSSSTPKRPTGCARGHPESWPTPAGCNSARRPGCRASTSTDGSCARARPARCPSGSAVTAAIVPPELGEIVDGISAAGGTPLVVGEVNSHRATAPPRTGGRARRHPPQRRGEAGHARPVRRDAR